MAVSEERIDELLEQMLDNADQEGWCHVPKGLSEEEELELTRRITIITMQDRIDNLMEGILTVFKYMKDIKEHITQYETMDKLKIKGGLATIKEDSQTILMDLHSDNKIHDFFRIDIIGSDDESSEEEISVARKEMEELIETEFKPSLEKIITYCHAMIEMSDDIVEQLNVK